MRLNKWGVKWVLAAVVLASALACRTTNVFVSQVKPTVTPTRTVRPTFTPNPTATNTPVPPTSTPVPVPTAVPTKKPTARPVVKAPTAVPKPAAPAAPAATAAPAASTYEWHVNPATCVHAGMTYIKGTAYWDRNNPEWVQAGVIVALGAPDGNTIYDRVLTDDLGQYTFILNSDGSRAGTWGVWIIYPDDRRKSDIGGPIKTNDLGPDTPGTCWAGGVDFWR